MKRRDFKSSIISVLLMSVAVMLFVAACGKEPYKEPEVSQATSQVTSEKASQEVSEMGIEPLGYSFDAQYIRTDGGYDEVDAPSYVLIESKEELDAYYEANKDIFDLECKEVVYSDTTIGFLDACDKYDEAYFEKRNLLLIILTEPSGSIRHRIVDVRRKNGNGDWIVSIETIVPEVCTDDMATWHLFLEVQFGKAITVDDIVHINPDNDWRTIGHGVSDAK